MYGAPRMENAVSSGKGTQDVPKIGLTLEDVIVDGNTADAIMERLKKTRILDTLSLEEAAVTVSRYKEAIIADLQATLPP